MKRILALSLALLFVVSSVPPLTHAATTPTLGTKVALPAGATTGGILYSGGYNYYSSYEYGFVMKVDNSAGTYSNVTTASGSKYQKNLWQDAVDGNGMLWITRRSVPNPPMLDGVGVTMINPTTKAETLILDAKLTTNTVSSTIYSGSVTLANGSLFALAQNGDWDGILYNSGNIYTAWSSKLFVISDTSPYATHAYTIPSGGGSYGKLALDGSGNVWFTDITNGQVCEFTTSVSCWGGYSHPLGIAFNSTAGYVAENAESGSTGDIAKFSTSTPATIASIAVTGEPVDIESVGGTMVWSSEDTSTRVVCALYGSCVNTGEQNFYLSTDGTKVYYSYFGSQGVGEIDGLTSATAKSSTQPTACSPAVSHATATNPATAAFNHTGDIVTTSANVTIPFYVSHQDALPPSFAVACQLVIDSASFDSLTLNALIIKVDGVAQPQSLNWVSSLPHLRGLLSCDSKISANFSKWPSCKGSILSIQVWEGSLSLSLPPILNYNQPHVITLEAWGQNGSQPTLASIRIYNGLYTFGGPSFVLQFPASDVGHYETVNATGLLTDWTPNGMLMQSVFVPYVVKVPVGGLVTGEFLPFGKLSVTGGGAVNQFAISSDYSTTQTFTVR